MPAVDRGLGKPVDPTSLEGATLAAIPTGVVVEGRGLTLVTIAAKEVRTMGGIATPMAAFETMTQQAESRSAGILVLEIVHGATTSEIGKAVRIPRRGMAAAGRAGVVVEGPTSSRSASSRRHRLSNGHAVAQIPGTAVAPTGTHPMSGGIVGLMGELVTNVARKVILHENVLKGSSMKVSRRKLRLWISSLFTSAH
mmetsp:Transcript_50819/g.111233  ORF Transcript_50819/g.111233 Transcript_50819/m.111233 type:complete len:197 (-) Transcript_50819:1703-2293(-)